MRIRQAKSPVYSRAFAERVAGAYKVDPGAALVVAPFVHLIKDPEFVVTPDLTLPALEAVEGDFTDYAAQAAVLSAPVNLGPNTEGVNSNVTFTMVTDPPVATNTIYGYWIEDATGLVSAEMFPINEEVAMASAGDQLILIPALPLTLYQSVSF